MSKNDVVVCPHCGGNNASRLYEHTYICNWCKKDFVYDKTMNTENSHLSHKEESLTTRSSYFSWMMMFLRLAGMAIVYVFVSLFSQPDRLTSVKDLLDQGTDSVVSFFKSHPDYFWLLIWGFSWIWWIVLVVSALANRDYFYTPPYGARMRIIVGEWRTGARIVGFVYGIVGLGVLALSMYMNYYH